MIKEKTTTQNLGKLDGKYWDDDEDEGEEKIFNVTDLYKIAKEKLAGNGARKFYLQDNYVVVHYPLNHSIKENLINFKKDWLEGGNCYDFLKEFYNMKVEIFSEETVKGDCKYGTYGYNEILIKV